jgi:hypothetical protein
VRKDIVFKVLAVLVMLGALYLTYWTARKLMMLELALFVFFDIFVFLNWTKAYARTQIRAYALQPKPEPVDAQDPGEL